MCHNFNHVNSFCTLTVQLQALRCSLALAPNLPPFSTNENMLSYQGSSIEQDFVDGFFCSHHFLEKCMLGQQDTQLLCLFLGPTHSTFDVAKGSFQLHFHSTLGLVKGIWFYRKHIC